MEAIPTLTAPVGFDALVRRDAFRLLLASGEPITEDQLTRSLAADPEGVASAVQRLLEAGRIRGDKAGRVVGSAGLSVVPDRHEIEIDGRRYWTWCAYDILGILGALKSSGRALTKSPATGTGLQLTFDDGRPQDSRLVLVRPDESFAACCANVYEEWCPNSNLFEDEPTARAWMLEHRVTGEVLALLEAALQATKEWLPLADPPGQ